MADDRGAVPAGALLTAIDEESGWLADFGVDRLGLLAGNGRSWVVSDLALLQAELVNVPLPQHFGAAQLTHALDSAGVDAVLTDATERITALGLGFDPVAVSPRTNLTLMTRHRHELPLLPPGTVKITYTSGSTAEPRGVCLSSAALEAVAASVAAVARTLGVRRHVSLLPLSTLLENVAGLYAAWLCGGTCHLPAAVPGAIGSGTLTPELLLREVTRQRPESLILVPELLRILVNAAEAGWQAPPDGKFFAVGGACVSPQLLERSAAAGLPVFEGYGLSECVSVQCLNTPAAQRRGSVGRPLPHARVRIDERGEICVGGTLMSGYVGQTALPADAEFATGDLGEIDVDGFVYVKGRIKNVFINSFGRNLSPEWIERELTQEPAIGQAIAVGEARPWVVALITPASPAGSRPMLEAAVARANARLPAYAQVVRFAVPPQSFTAANGLLTGNGRPRRERILERHAHLIEELYWQALAG